MTGRYYHFTDCDRRRTDFSGKEGEVGDGIDGPNGVYHYGSASALPSDTYHASNYWVDVVFTTQ